MRPAILLFLVSEVSPESVPSSGKSLLSILYVQQVAVAVAVVVVAVAVKSQPVIVEVDVSQEAVAVTRPPDPEVVVSWQVT